MHADAILPSPVADRGVTVLRCFQPLSHRFPLCVFLSAHLDHQASQPVGLWALPLRPRLYRTADVPEIELRTGVALLGVGPESSKGGDIVVSPICRLGKAIGSHSVPWAIASLPTRAAATGWPKRYPARPGHGTGADRRAEV